MPSMCQRRITVADLETRRLLRDVRIGLDSGDTLRTSWRGYAVLPDTAQYHHITLSHPLYFTRSLERSELTDTVYLMSSGKMLGEVVVYGKKMRQNVHTYTDPIDLQLQNIHPTGEVNFLGLLYDFVLKPIMEKRRSRQLVKKERRQMILNSY